MASSFPRATSGWDRGSSTASGPPAASSVDLDGRQHARPHQADADDDRTVPPKPGYSRAPLRHASVAARPDAVVADLRAAFAEADARAA